VDGAKCRVCPSVGPPLLGHALRFAPSTRSSIPTFERPWIEISVAVAVSCPHRHQAFDACRWMIDTLKEVVPIWKKEVWADGTEEWVHPGLDPSEGRA